MIALIKDILYCLKLSMYFFIVAFILGLIVGVISSPHELKVILGWGCRMVQILGMIGLLITAISSTKRDLLRPLNYDREWNLYFEKMNLNFVIFTIAISISIVSYFAEGIFKQYL